LSKAYNYMRMKEGIINTMQNTRDTYMVGNNIVVD